MSENQTAMPPSSAVAPAADSVQTQQAQPQSNGSEIVKKVPMPLVVYVLMGIGLFVPLLPFIGVVIAHVYKAQETDPVAVSHFSYLIRTYWWGLMWFLLGVVLSMVVIGYFVLLGYFVWTIYRLVKGISVLSNNQVIR